MGSNGKSSKVSAVVVGSKGDLRRYSMFDVSTIDENRAFLGGPLLFECDETFAMELKFADGTTVRLDALVEEAVLTGEPGVWVSFSVAPPRDRERLRKKLDTATIWG